MTNTFVFMKKVHRYLVLGILVLGLAMGITGLLLKFPKIAADYLTFIDLGYIRFLHNNLSTYFSVVFFIMMLTGIWMYLYPGWVARRQRRQTERNHFPPPEASASPSA